jgi:hypothetical protein
VGNKQSSAKPCTGKQNRTKKTEQASNITAQTNEKQPTQQKNSGWAGVHYQLYQSEMMRD